MASVRPCAHCLDAERAIAWRAADSFALREFLGFALPEAPPDHWTISRTRRLIDLETHVYASTGLDASFRIARRMTPLRPPAFSATITTCQSASCRPRQDDSHAWSTYASSGRCIGHTGRSTF